MAKNFDKWGMYSFSYGCYDRAYKGSDKIDEQYVMFEKAVNLDYNKHIIYYAEKMLGNADFEAFCIVTNASNYDKAERFCTENMIVGNAKIKLMLSVMNEENYIKNKYVNSLIKADKLNDAFNFAMADVKNECEKTNVSYDVTFLLSSVVSAGKKLSTSEAENVKALYDKLTTYLSGLEKNNGVLVNDKDKLVALRTCEISSTLEIVYSNLGLNSNAEAMKAAFNTYRGMIYG